MPILIFTSVFFFGYIFKMENEAPKYQPKLPQLKNLLNMAVSSENYELAAKIRDKIYEIQKKTSESLGSSSQMGRVNV